MILPVFSITTTSLKPTTDLALFEDGHKETWILSNVSEVNHSTEGFQ